MGNNGEQFVPWDEQKVQDAMRSAPNFPKAIAHLLNLQPVLTQELGLLRLVAQAIVEAVMAPKMPPAIIVPGQTERTSEQRTHMAMQRAAELAMKWQEWMEAQQIPFAKEKDDAVQDGD